MCRARPRRERGRRSVAAPPGGRGWCWMTRRACALPTRRWTFPAARRIASSGVRSRSRERRCSCARPHASSVVPGTRDHDEVRRVEHRRETRATWQFLRTRRCPRMKKSLRRPAIPRRATARSVSAVYDGPVRCSSISERDSRVDDPAIAERDEREAVERGRHRDRPADAADRARETSSTSIELQRVVRGRVRRRRDARR